MVFHVVSHKYLVGTVSFDLTAFSWLYASEIASLRLRNKGSALQSMLNWITCFLTVMTTP
jgi:hypothetical protein